MRSCRDVTSVTNGPARVPPSRTRWPKIERHTLFSQNPEQEQWQMVEKEEDSDQTEQSGEQTFHEQEEGLLG